jgi:hypothetical protein
MVAEQASHHLGRAATAASFPRRRDRVRHFLFRDTASISPWSLAC